jgi:hypothetical protein
MANIVDTDGKPVMMNANGERVVMDTDGKPVMMTREQIDKVLNENHMLHTKLKVCMAIIKAAMPHVRQIAQQAGAPVN